jgi:pimeloyl-ACP methyl ester carboxylesterase
MASAMLRASLQVPPACGHWLPRDQPDAFAAAVDAFLAPGEDDA